jgi:signal peptidase I
VTHTVLNILDSSSDNTPVFTVPDEHFFFMGDNRDNSSDSRISRRTNGLGYVPFENLVGRADRIMFSSAGSSIFAFWTWRSDRFFKAVNP